MCRKMWEGMDISQKRNGVAKSKQDRGKKGERKAKQEQKWLSKFCFSFLPFKNRLL